MRGKESRIGKKSLAQKETDLLGTSCSPPHPKGIAQQCIWTCELAFCFLFQMGLWSASVQLDVLHGSSGSPFGIISVHRDLASGLCSGASFQWLAITLWRGYRLVCGCYRCGWATLDASPRDPAFRTSSQDFCHASTDPDALGSIPQFGGEDRHDHSGGEWKSLELSRQHSLCWTRWLGKPNVDKCNWNAPWREPMLSNLDVHERRLEDQMVEKEEKQFSGRFSRFCTHWCAHFSTWVE